MTLIKTEDAVGHTLCHDITQIIKGVTKDAVFRKGHIVSTADIPVLLSVGKEHLYVWEHDNNVLHENDAAYILRDICMGENISAAEPKEGKVDLYAEVDGLLTVDAGRLLAINALGEMMIATRHGGFAVKKGDKIAGTRVIPLVIEKEKMQNAVKAAGDVPILNVIPFKSKKVGIIVTGSEVCSGRIADTFTPVVEQKLAWFGSELVSGMLPGDDHEKITIAINEMLTCGMDMVICTGGMSVDPDDRTPLAIKNSGAKIVSYGAPTLPGAMFMLAYSDDSRPILGLPGCVMYAQRTVFDLVLPYLMADIEISADSLAGYGEGGLCLNCENCVFPNCAFGK